MAGIPENVIFEILLLLPVSSLSRFRCVSKQWRQLIDSSDFAKSHFNCSAIREEDRPLVIFYEKFYSYLVKLDSIRNDPPPPILIQHPYPRWKEVHDYYSVVGTCNGLICVRDIDRSALVISNPLTGKHLRFRLPEADGVSFEWFGFGYDRVSDDYKVASVGRSGDWERNHYGKRIFYGRFMVQIYSVRCGRWRKLGVLRRSLVCDTYKLKKGVFAGGALHWEVEIADGFLGRSSKRSILRLDLGKLEYTVKALPKECARVISVAAVDGCLWLICSRRGGGLDVWVMKTKNDGYRYWSRLIRSAGLQISRPFAKWLMMVRQCYLLLILIRLFELKSKRGRFIKLLIIGRRRIWGIRSFTVQLWLFPKLQGILESFGCGRLLFDLIPSFASFFYLRLSDS